MAAVVGSLEEEAVERKAKLKSLRAKRSEQQSSEDSPSNKESSKPKLKFRNYNPQTEELKEKKLPKAKPENVEPQIQDQLEAAQNTDLGDVNLANLAPKKVDWDLKRDIAKKLERLERKTQRAIVELIRERLQGEEEGALASAVAAVGTAKTEEDSD